MLVFLLSRSLMSFRKNVKGSFRVFCFLKMILMPQRHILGWQILFPYKCIYDCLITYIPWLNFQLAHQPDACSNQNYSFRLAKSLLFYVSLPLRLLRISGKATGQSYFAFCSKSSQLPLTLKLLVIYGLPYPVRTAVMKQWQVRGM